MLVTLTGAGGTGKTTILKSMEELGWTVVPSVTRSVTVDKWGLETEDAQKALTPEQLWALQRDISDAHEASLQEAMEESKQGKNVIADRSSLDHLCYALFKSNGAMAEDGSEFFALETRVRKSLRGVDLLVYCPTGLFTPEPDGHRTANENERQMLDTLIRGYLHRWKGQFNLMTMSIKDPDLRIKHLVSTIQQVKHPNREINA
jgi:predicted ATPase